MVVSFHAHLLGLLQEYGNLPWCMAGANSYLICATLPPTLPSPQHVHMAVFEDI